VAGVNEAQRLIDGLLTGFVEDGGRLSYDENGDELTVAELFSARSPHAAKPPLTEEEYQERIDALTPTDLQRIDDALMAGASTQFRKVARVVGTAMSAKEVEDRIPDYFYASRVRKLRNLSLSPRSFPCGVSSTLREYARPHTLPFSVYRSGRSSCLR
jgi:hypothetical protein